MTKRISSIFRHAYLSFFDVQYVNHSEIYRHEKHQENDFVFTWSDLSNMVDPEPRIMGLGGLDIFSNPGKPKNADVPIFGKWTFQSISEF